MSLELKTELFMAMEDYERIASERRNNGLDIQALDSESNDRVLLRVITKPRSKSGFVGADTVDRMVAAINDEEYDRGVLISNKFTRAAERKLEEEGIQIISDDFMRSYVPKRLYVTTRDLVDVLCKAKCGKIPQKESDCKGHLDGNYTCKVRLVSDNASFHFQRGWKSLLQEDVLQLLAMDSSKKDQVHSDN